LCGKIQHKMKKKIIMIGPHPPNVGGISTCIENIETELDNEFEFIKYNTTALSYKKLYKAYKLLIYPFYLIDNSEKIVHIHTPSYGSFWYNMIYLCISKIFGLKVILHIHGGSFDQFYLNSKKQEKIRRYIQRADRVIVLSKYWARFFDKICDQDKMIIIPNSVKIQKITAKLNTNNVLFVGSDWKRKGVHDILKACKLSVRKHEQIRFIIAGEDKTFNMKEEIKKNGIEQNLILAGNILGKKKDSFFLKSSVFILPSYNENLPITILEAMSYGIPVISTNVGGIPEIITPGYNGYIIKPGDFIDLGKKIIAILKNKKLRKKMGKNALMTIKKSYSNELIISKIKEVYLQ
jgi:glycosyltransferase involved in cell wall biosynthesis